MVSQKTVHFHLPLFGSDYQNDSENDVDSYLDSNVEFLFEFIIFLPSSCTISLVRNDIGQFLFPF